jgi:histidine ammonia-lyase
LNRAILKNMTDTLVLTGNDLTIASLVAAARTASSVTLSADSRAKMLENRSFAMSIAARGDDVYGLTTGVGMRKNRKISDSAMVQFNTRMIQEHAMGQGPPIATDVTRAAAIVLLNTLAKGYSNVRIEVADVIARRLSEGPPLADIPLYGGCSSALASALLPV